MGTSCSKRRQQTEDEWEIIPQPQRAQHERRGFPRVLPTLRWQAAKRVITKILTLKKIWASLGRYISTWDAVQRALPENRRAARIWGSLGRRLQILKSKQLTGHLVREKGRLKYGRQ